MTEQQVPPVPRSGTASAGQFVERMGTIDFPGNSGGATAEIVFYARERFHLNLFEHLGIALPPQIASSASRRQADFLAGRLAVRNAMRSAGFPETDILIGDRRQPLWPEGITGSLSHNGRIAIARSVPGDASDIGVDVEDEADGPSLAALLKFAISTTERTRLLSWAPEMGLPALVTLAFSAKESFFKAAFRAVDDWFDFPAVEVCGFDLGSKTLRMATTRSLCATLPSGIIIDALFRRVDTRAWATMVNLPRS